VSTLTRPKLTVKLSFDSPSGIRSDEGASAQAVSETEIETLAPPLGATPLRLTIAFPVHPLYCVPEILSEAIPSGLTVTLAERVVRPSVAAITEIVELVTRVELTTNVPETCPAGISIDAGTATAGSELVSAISIPPLGATAVSFTVPLAADCPPTIDAGRIDTPATVTGTTFTVVDLVAPLNEPESVTLVVLLT
jgi:hypothetical protein